eukprot:1159120-Pelagomonas_calceolata.AAC.3
MTRPQKGKQPTARLLFPNCTGRACKVKMTPYGGRTTSSMAFRPSLQSKSLQRGATKKEGPTISERSN